MKNILNKLNAESKCTVGFKMFMYFSFAIIWLEFLRIA